MNFKFENQTIIITGATRGIGKQIAEDLQLIVGHMCMQWLSEKINKTHGQ